MRTSSTTARLAAAALCAVASRGAARAQEAGSARVEAAEYDLKAAYLYRFLFFVHGPAAAAAGGGGRVTIAVLGRDPFTARAFADVDGRPVGPGGATVVIRRIPAGAPLPDLADTHLLYVAASERRRVPEVLAHAGRWPVLTVGDTDGFLEAGGMLNLVRYDRTIRWEINRDPARRCRLRIDSQLLRNALRVLDGSKPPAAGGGEGAP